MTGKDLQTIVASRVRKEVKKVSSSCGLQLCIRYSLTRFLAHTFIRIGAT